MIMLAHSLFILFMTVWLCTPCDVHSCALRRYRIYCILVTCGLNRKNKVPTSSGEGSWRRPGSTIPSASTGRSEKRLREPGQEDDAQRDTKPSRIGAINALQAICEETPEIEDTHLGVADIDETLQKRQALAGSGKCIVRVVQKSSVTTRALTSRWVVTVEKAVG